MSAVVHICPALTTPPRLRATELVESLVCGADVGAVALSGVFLDRREARNPLALPRTDGVREVVARLVDCDRERCEAVLEAFELGLRCGFEVLAQVGLFALAERAAARLMSSVYATR